MKYLLIATWVTFITLGPFKLNCPAQTGKADPQTEHRPSPQSPPTVSNVTTPKDESPTGKKTEEGKPKPIRITEMPPDSTWYKTYVITTIDVTGLSCTS